MKKNLISTLATTLLAITFIFMSCKKEKDDETTPVPTNTEQKLSFHLHNMVGSGVASYGATFQDSSGRKFNISDFRYYISNVVLIKNDGSEYPLTGKVLLADPATQDYDLANVPVGTYNGFKFMMGLDSSINYSDPTVYPITNPLSIQTPSIHWSWSIGYIFMKLEGQVDTTLMANGPVDYSYFYHIALDDMKRTIDFSNEAFTISSGSDKEIALKFDLLKAFSGVDLRTENQTNSSSNRGLASRIADNWQAAFSVE